MRFSAKIFTRRNSTGATPPVPLTRPDFYRISSECRALALDYARYDQHRVNLDKCHDFNRWAAELRGYRQLLPTLASMGPARPITRRQILILGVLLGVIALLGLPRIFGQNTSTVLLYSYLLLLLLAGFVPERLYGTSIEQLEGKVLRIVDRLDVLLLSGEMEFSEAVFFQVKENLMTARDELRQQIDLAHRRF